MRGRVIAAVLPCLAMACEAAASDRFWENPVFSTEEQALSAARTVPATGDSGPSAARRLFVDLTLGRGARSSRHGSGATARLMVDNLLITHPVAFARNEPQRRTIDRFIDEVPRQRAVLEKRLELFGYPETPGLVYCRLVESVDAFAGLNGASSDKMSQVGGVTYYCRYVVLPLSFVGEKNIRELRRSAGLNPSIDVDDTIRRWQRESFANLVNTFRHELVHVRTNTTLGVPLYSDRRAFPTWFHEGTATYLAADPRSGLSKGYQEFQGLFFYLVQRHGVSSLQRFYSKVFGGTDVRSALSEVYGITGAEQLFRRSNRWYRTRETLKTGLWLAALTIVFAAFRGTRRPVIGLFQLLASGALILAAAGGLAEHLYGLRGPEVVLAVKSGLGVLAVGFGVLGVRRILRHRRPQNALD